MQIAASAAANMLARRARTVAERTLAVLGEPPLLDERDTKLEALVFQVRSLSQAVRAGSAELFVDYATWARSVEDSRALEPRGLERQLRGLLRALQEELPDAAPFLGGFIQAALARLAEPPKSQEPLVAEGELAARYLACLLAYDRVGALALINHALASGLPVRQVYREVIERAQHELGRLWQLDRITVAEEHYCTAVTQLALAGLYPRLLAASTGPRLVMACVEGELHELGARMVADFFELDGWDTTYLGASTPMQSVLEVLRERRPNLLGISVTMAFNLSPVWDLVRAVRSDPELASLKILVGGRPFALAEGFWERIGADGTAANADEAVEVGRRLLGANALSTPLA
jgi:methanogenic corrinoid protein MtbC1